MLGKLDNTIVNEECSNDVFEGVVEQATASSNVLLDGVLAEVSTGVNDYDTSTLFLAADSGCIDIVDACVKHGCDVNAKDIGTTSDTALHKCARHGHVSVCRLLLEAGCNVNAKNSFGETALSLCCERGCHDMVQWLIDRGADVNARSNDGVTPLLCAVSHSHASVSMPAPIQVLDAHSNSSLPRPSSHSCVVEQLLSQGQCDINARCTAEKTALHAAAEADSVDITRLLLASGASAAAVDSMGRTPLALAAQLGHVAAVRTLTCCHGSINSTNNTGMTALHWAVAGRHIECVRAILQADTDTSVANVGTGNTAVITAVEVECVEIVRLLILANCNVNAINWCEHSALHEAAERGLVDIGELLLSGGAYVDMQTSAGDTALILATRRGHAGIAQLLIDSNCNVKMANGDHVTALHEAAMNGHLHITGMLLATTDTPIDHAEMEGDTPLILAATRGHRQVVAMLLAQRQCDPNRTNDMGRSALLEACEHGHTAITSLLLRNGADVNVYDSEGDSALILAAARGHCQVVSVLLRVGCNVSHVNRWGRNALHEACSVWSGPSSTVELLALSGINIDDVDDMGNTPLMLATLGCRSDIVRALLSTSCDVNKAGTTQVRPLEIAVIKESVEIMQMLYAAGCDMNGIDESTADTVSHHVAEWLQSVASRPQPLKQICRAAVRMALCSPIDHKVSVLPLPRQIKQYLLFDDIDHLVVLPGVKVKTATHGDSSSGSDADTNNELDVEPLLVRDANF